MKKLISISCIALLGAVLTISCNKERHIQSVPHAQEEEAILYVSLSGIDTDISTRASTTAEHSGDKTAATTQILIYDSDGNYIKSMDAAGSVTLSKGLDYVVVANINGPDFRGASLSTVFSYSFSLASYPWVMTAVSSANLTSSSSASVTLSVRSLASRIHLCNITNSLPPALGDIVIKKVFLCNAMGACDISGTPSATWLNPYGRKILTETVTPHSLTGSVDNTVNGAAYTFKSFDDDVVNNSGPSFEADAWFYAYPNERYNVIPDGLASSTSWSPQATWLTVCGTVAGTVYYWTANLGASLQDGLQSNKTYDVSINIKNLGTGDPATPTEPGTAGLSVSITPWQAGSDISETI